ncbi:MAG: glycosyltransferase family 4 protein [Anaerolineales bacterium]|jgi:glycosyltransferase involved in cell wall biosynthesis
MKVLFIADRHDPHDHDAGSGVDYMIYQAMEQKGLEIAVVGPFRIQPNLAERIYHRIHRQFIEKRAVKYPLSYLKETAEQVKVAIQKENPDVLFTKHAATLAYCKFSAPLAYLTDTTLKGGQEQWPIFTGWAYKRMLAWESRVIQKSSQVITNSHWSAGILRDFYRVPDENISVYPNPASIPEKVMPGEIVYEERDFNPIRLLLVGREYYRKGVDIAIDVVRMLNKRGFKTDLRVVGLDGQDKPNVRFMGLYKKTIPEELSAYVENYRWANFLIHPARFEAAGIVPGEAAAFGVPTITNSAGGLATTVADGVSGVVLPKGSPAEAYVETILRYVNDEDAYLLLSRTSRKRYETELNWKYAGNIIIDALARAIERGER